MTPQEKRFTRLFDPAERELRTVLGGSVPTRTFYSVLGIVHTLANQAAQTSPSRRSVSHKK